jgi:hypothetical protein
MEYLALYFMAMARQCKCKIFDHKVMKCIECRFKILCETELFM